MYFLGILQNIGDAIGQSLRSLMGGIIVKIYELIEYMYLLFNYLAKAEILDNNFVTGIYRKVGMILGLFMIFKLTFSLVEALITPEKLTDKKTGFSQVIARCVISIVLLGITPSLFREAFKIQNYIVGSSNKDNVIYKLVVGKNVTGDFQSMGRVIASNIYFSFFTDEDNNLNKGIKDTIVETDANYYDRFRVDNYANLVEDVENQNLSFSDTLPYLTIQENGKYVIEFDWLLSLLFGIVFLYLMFTYCIQVATRVIQLAYLQLIAPVPILSYISDPDGAFKKWLKQCGTTFLDLFIRLAIIYFIMAIIDDVIYQFNQTSGVIFDSTGIPTENYGLLMMVKVFIILGLLMFGKKVPDLLKDLFPNMGGGAASLGFGLKSPKKMFSDIPLLGGPANKVLGYAEGLGKRAGKFVWNHTGAAAGKAVWNRTGGRIQAKYNNRKEDRKNAAEIREMEKPGEHLYNKYGKNIDQAFKNDEYRDSYNNLKMAKDENRAAEKEYEEAKASGDANRLTMAIDRKNNAAKALSDAQKTHDNMRKRYGADARKEDEYNMYKSMHPNKFASNNNDNTRPDGNNQQSRPTSTSNNTNTQQSQLDNTRTIESSEDGNPYESGYGQYVNNNSSNQSAEVDDNPYTNPNYYNDNNSNSNNNNNDNDEFDGSNYY